MTELGLSMGLSPREPLKRLVGLVKEAESRGVSTCWIIDSQLAMKDAYLTLAVLVWETSTIKLGPGVTNLVTRHETVVANAMATLADVAPGRALLGFGAGDSSVFPLGRKPLAINACREGVVRLRELLRGEAVTAGGRELKLSFTPAVPPPIYIAASQPRMLGLAGAVADGVIIMGPADVDMVRMQMHQVDDGARSVGRDPGEVYRDLWVTLSVGEGSAPVEDVKSWGSAQARWMASFKHIPASLERFRPEMQRAKDDYEFSSHLSLRAGHAHVISDEFAQVLAVAGEHHACLERLAELAAVGPDRITLTLLSGGRERRLDTIMSLWEKLQPQPSR